MRDADATAPDQPPAFDPAASWAETLRIMESGELLPPGAAMTDAQRQVLAFARRMAAAAEGGTA